MYETIWSGDWHARVLERAQQRGFATVTQYAAARVGLPLIELAEELGPDDIVADQVTCLLIEEATRADAIRPMLRDLFVRELREAIPHGWRSPLDDEARSEIAGALARWKTTLADYLDNAAAFTAGQQFMNAERPTGWLPSHPDDPVIVAFVDRCCGRLPS